MQIRVLVAWLEIQTSCDVMVLILQNVEVDFKKYKLVVNLNGEGRASESGRLRQVAPPKKSALLSHQPTGPAAASQAPPPRWAGAIQHHE